MSSYTQETYKADKLALDAAKNELNCLVLGEGIGRTEQYQGEYGRIAQYFGDKNPVDGITHYGATVRRVARMFVVISTAKRISGFNCNVYSALLNEIEKKIKGMRVFRRRAKIRCLVPELHGKGCVCADWKRLTEASSESQESGPVRPSAAEIASLARIV